MYAIDKTAAIEADNHGGFLTETGKYKGHFLRAEKLVSKNKGTHGIGFTFEDDSKRSTRFDIWTRSGSGDNLMGYKTLQAMMTVMGLRNITPAQGIVDRYDYDTKTTSKVQAEVFNDLVGKPVGLVLRSTEYEKMRDGRLTGETGWRLELVAPFRPADEFTSSEIMLSHTKALKLPALIATLADRPLKARPMAAPRPDDGYGGAIPFGHPAASGFDGGDDSSIPF